MEPRHTKNASYVSAGFYSALCTMFGGAWYFLFSLATAAFNGGDVGQVIGNTLLGCFICWVFLTFVFYEVGKAFDDMNEEGRKRMREREEAEERARRDQNDNSSR